MTTETDDLVKRLREMLADAGLLSADGTYAQGATRDFEAVFDRLSAQGEPVAWASDEALRKLSRGSPTAIDALRDGDAVHPLYLAPPSREEGLRERLRKLHEPAIITSANNARLGITAHTVRSIVRDYLNAHPALRALSHAEGGDNG